MRPTALTRVVGTVDLLGILAVAAVALLARDESTLRLGIPHAWLVPLLFALTVAGELTAVRLRHGEEDEELTLFEAAVVVDVLLLPPSQSVLVPIAALAVASALVRRPLVKAVFNLGSYGLSTAVLVGTVALVPHASHFSPWLVVALLAGTLGFAATNLVCLAKVLQVAADAPVRETIREGWRLSAVMAVGTVAVGTVALQVAMTSPVLLPFTLLPAAALTYAYRAAAQESEERQRSGRLLELSQVLAGRLDPDDLVASFLRLTREAFRAETALVVLEAGAGVVAAEGSGVETRGASPFDLALLERATTGGEVVDGALPGEATRVLVVPLEAEGMRLGAVALVDRARGRRRTLGPRDLTVLGPLASALAVALRGAEHLERLVEETGKLKAVVSHSTDGILVLDGDGSVLMWNPAMEQITGVAEADAVGAPLRGLLTAQDGQAQSIDPLAAGWSQLTPSNPRALVEMGLTRLDGEVRWVRASHAAIYDATNEQPALVRDVVLVHDVTKQRQVDRLKADFIATVSHELRTPVTPIKGYTELLRKRGETFTPEKRKECLDVIADRVAHLARLVEDLLLASRVASPASAVEMARGDFGELVGKAVGDFAVEAARITLTRPEGPIPVACDPVRMSQVVSNLVANALKYSDEGSPVDIHVTLAAAAASVTVTDAGRGIPADQLESVFEKFHRVEDPMLMTTGGTGLGLYIAQQLAEAMHGTITVRSTLGVGSTFCFTLPLLAEGAALPAAAGAVPAPRPEPGRGRPPFPVLRRPVS